MFLRERGSKSRNIWSGEVPSREFLLRNNPNNRARAPFYFLFFFLFLLLIKRREERKGEIIHTHTQTRACVCVWMARHTLAVVVCSRSLECPLCFFIIIYSNNNNGTTPLSFSSLSKNCLPVLLYLRWDSYNRSSAFFLSIHDGKKRQKKKKERKKCVVPDWYRSWTASVDIEANLSKKLAPFVSYLQRVIAW